MKDATEAVSHEFLSMSRRAKTVKLSLAAIVIALLCWFITAIENDIFGHDVPLYTAAQEGNWGQVQALLARGADPNDTTDLQNDRTALFWACYQGRVDMVKLLIQKGVNVNSVDTHGQTALDYAAGPPSGPKSEVVRVLRQAGAKTGAEL